MQDSYNIIIGGVNRFITSYEKFLFHENGDLDLDAGSITPHQYLSILFNNLGYTRCPKDLSWIHNGVPIESVPKTEAIDFPITKNKLMIYDGRTTLYDLIVIIKNWIRGGLERGHLLDTNKSFRRPNYNEMSFNLNNGIMIKKSAAIKVKLDYWEKTDIFTRRLYNLSPNLDREYFKYSITNFEEYTKQIIVSYPHAIFASCIVDPDIFFSVLRKAEKEAFRLVYSFFNELPSYALVPDYLVAREFIDTLYMKEYHLYKIYHHAGASGFVRPTVTIHGNFNMIDPTLGYNSVSIYKPLSLYAGNFDNITIDAIKQQIDNTPLDGDHKSYILQYIDNNSLKFLDAFGDFSEVRINTYKKLYYTLTQIKENNPELLNRKEKFIFSEPFYVNQETFALYNRTKNKFFITSSDLLVREMNPQEAVDYYRLYMNMIVYLDPREIADNFDSPCVDDVDIEQLERLAYINNVTRRTLPKTPIMNNNAPVIVSNDISQYNNEMINYPQSNDNINLAQYETLDSRNYYIFDPSKLVQFE